MSETQIEIQNEPEDSLTLTTRAQWKAISHPIRLAILGLLIESPQTNEEMAKKLEIVSGQLHFHTKTLLTAGLIRVVATRQKGHLTEKLYRAVARHWVAQPPTLTGDAPPLLPAIQAGMSLYQESWGIAPTEVSPQIGFHLVLEHSPEKIAEFEGRLRALFAEFHVPSTEGSGEGAIEGTGKIVAITALLHGVPQKGHRKE
jgi:DNA-binding transcriptional ArsR family regulator